MQNKQNNPPYSGKGLSHQPPSFLPFSSSLYVRGVISPSSLQTPQSPCTLAPRRAFNTQEPVPPCSLPRKNSAASRQNLLLPAPSPEESTISPPPPQVPLPSQRTFDQRPSPAPRHSRHSFPPHPEFRRGSLQISLATGGWASPQRSLFTPWRRPPSPSRPTWGGGSSAAASLPISSGEAPLNRSPPAGSSAPLRSLGRPGPHLPRAPRGSSLPGPLLSPPLLGPPPPPAPRCGLRYRSHRKPSSLHQSPPGLTSMSLALTCRTVAAATLKEPLYVLWLRVSLRGGGGRGKNPIRRNYAPSLETSADVTQLVLKALPAGISPPPRLLDIKAKRCGEVPGDSAFRTNRVHCAQ